MKAVLHSIGMVMRRAYVMSCEVWESMFFSSVWSFIVPDLALRYLVTKSEISSSVSRLEIAVRIK